MHKINKTWIPMNELGKMKQDNLTTQEEVPVKRGKGTISSSVISETCQYCSIFCYSY